MKKLILLVAAVVAVSFASCGNKAANTEAVVEEEALEMVEVEEATEPEEGEEAVAEEAEAVEEVAEVAEEAPAAE